MPILLFGTTNRIIDDKLNLIVKNCVLIVASKTEYSVFDLPKRKRLLYKLFNTADPKKKFDINNPFDVFRVLAIHCQALIDEAISSSFMANDVKDFVNFVSEPVLPVVYQQVGIGIDYDFEYQGRPYKAIEQELPYGYGIIYDLTRVYRFEQDKIKFIVVHPKNKDILVPSTVKISSPFIQGVSVIARQPVKYSFEETWIVPKAQYVKWSNLVAKLPWIKSTRNKERRHG